MINAGRFTARPTGAQLGFTNGGSEQIGIAFEILDGPDAGQFITAYRYFTDAAFQYAIKDMRTCGWLGDDVSDVSSIGGDDAPDVNLVIEHEEYDGKIQAKVKWINALNDGGVQMANVMDAGQRTSFAARMKAKVRALNAAAAQDAKSSGRAAPTTTRTPPARAPSRPAAQPRPEPEDFGPPPPGFDEEAAF